MIFKVFKRPATLSKEPKEYYTLLFTVNKSSSPATVRTKSHYQPAAGM